MSSFSSRAGLGRSRARPPKCRSEREQANAPWCSYESPHTTVNAGKVAALLRADDVHDALAGVVHLNSTIPYSAQFASSVST